MTAAVHLSPSFSVSLSLRDTPHTQTQEIIRASLCGYFLSEKLGRPRWDYYNSSSFVEDLQIWLCVCLWKYLDGNRVLTCPAWPESLSVSISVSVHGSNGQNKHTLVLCWTISEEVFPWQLFQVKETIFQSPDKWVEMQARGVWSW